MTAEQIVGLVLALLLMTVGLAGCVLPGLPGTPLVLAGAIAHRIWFGATSVNNWILALLVLLTIVSVALDYLASTLGAKKMGATWRGMTGAIAGAVVGLFFGIPGILLGPFLGALLLEMLGGYEFKPALKAGLGAFLGLIAGGIGKFAVALVMMTLFVVSVLYRTMA